MSVRRAIVTLSLILACSVLVVGVTAEFRWYGAQTQEITVLRQRITQLESQVVELDRQGLHQLKDGTVYFDLGWRDGPIGKMRQYLVPADQSVFVAEHQSRPTQ